MWSYSGRVVDGILRVWEGTPFWARLKHASAAEREAMAVAVRRRRFSFDVGDGPMGVTDGSKEWERAPQGRPYVHQLDISTTADGRAALPSLLDSLFFSHMSQERRSRGVLADKTRRTHFIVLERDRKSREKRAHTYSLGREMRQAERWGPNGENIELLRKALGRLTTKQVAQLARQAEIATAVRDFASKKISNFYGYDGDIVKPLRSPSDLLAPLRWNHYDDKRHLQEQQIRAWFQKPDPVVVADQHYYGSRWTALLQEGCFAPAVVARLSNKTVQRAELVVEVAMQAMMLAGIAQSDGHPCDLTPTWDDATTGPVAEQVLDPITYVLMTQPLRAFVGDLPGDEQHRQAAEYFAVLNCGIIWNALSTGRRLFGRVAVDPVTLDPFDKRSLPVTLGAQEPARAFLTAQRERFPAPMEAAYLDLVRARVVAEAWVIPASGPPGRPVDRISSQMRYGLDDELRLQNGVHALTEIVETLGQTGIDGVSFFVKYTKDNPMRPSSGHFLEEAKRLRDALDVLDVNAIATRTTISTEVVEPIADLMRAVGLTPPRVKHSLAPLAR